MKTKFPPQAVLNFLRQKGVRHLSHNTEDQIRLTLKAPITTAADDIRKYFFIVFQRISVESSARQRSLMKNQALFSLKDKKLKCRLLQFLFGTLRINQI